MGLAGRRRNTGSRPVEASAAHRAHFRRKTQITAGVHHAELPLGAAPANERAGPLEQGGQPATNPVRNARGTKAQTTPPGKPLRRRPWKLTTERNRPMVAALPTFAILEGVGRLALEPSGDGVGGVKAALRGHLGYARAGCRGPSCRRQRTLRDVRAGYSPAGRRCSPPGPVRRRCSASSVASGEASTPAAHTVV